MSRSGWFGGAAPLSNELDHHAVLSTFEFGRGGGYAGGSGGAVDPSLSYQTVSVDLNSSQETGVLNKLVPGPWGGVTRGVPTAPDFPAGERGGSKTWTIGNPRAHGFQQNTSPGMSVTEESATGSTFVLEVESFRKRKLVESPRASKKARLDLPLVWAFQERRNVKTVNHKAKIDVKNRILFPSSTVLISGLPFE